MKFVTFNIRRDNHKDGKNNFDRRLPLILSKIEGEAPDIICFQEVLPHVKDILQEKLSGYTLIGRGRGKDFKEEAVPVAVKNETMEIVEFKTFWLSENPDIPGTRFKGQSIFPRICSSLTVRDKKTDTFFRIFNTHLDHVGEEARFLGMKCLLGRMNEEQKNFHLPVILSGDFNEEPASKVLDLVRRSEAGLKDITSFLDITYHDYYYGRKKASKIDYIFTSPEFSAGSVLLWQDEKDGVYLSDHYPVCAEISLKQENGEAI